MNNKKPEIKTFTGWGRREFGFSMMLAIFMIVISLKFLMNSIYGAIFMWSIATIAILSALNARIERKIVIDNRGAVLWRGKKKKETVRFSDVTEIISYDAFTRNSTKYIILKKVDGTQFEIQDASEFPVEVMKKIFGTIVAKAKRYDGIKVDDQLNWLRED